jgi:hypothetical protein
MDRATRYMEIQEAQEARMLSKSELDEQRKLTQESTLAEAQKATAEFMRNTKDIKDPMEFQKAMADAAATNPAILQSGEFNSYSEFKTNILTKAQELGSKLTPEQKERAELANLGLTVSATGDIVDPKDPTQTYGVGKFKTETGELNLEAIGTAKFQRNDKLGTGVAAAGTRADASGMKAFLDAQKEQEEAMAIVAGLDEEFKAATKNRDKTEITAKRKAAAAKLQAATGHVARVQKAYGINTEDAPPDDKDKNPAVTTGLSDDEKKRMQELEKAMIPLFSVENPSAEVIESRNKMMDEFVTLDNKRTSQPKPVDGTEKAKEAASATLSDEDALAKYRARQQNK